MEPVTKSDSPAPFQELLVKRLKSLIIHFKLMQKCSRCNNDTKVTYNCDHTNNFEMCSECYQ
ncbi:MAG: hypothetical protein WCC79_05340, partial [Nitrososphaeraceae archaeon]